MDMMQPVFWVAVGQIILVNVILSGDNAVVIALACRMLPPRQRFWGMILGAGAAVLLRVLFTLVVAQAMGYPYLKLVGGLLLLWVAVKLVVPEESDDEHVEAATNLWRAVWIVTVADIVMSLDNVIAIAAAAELAAARVDVAHADAIKAILIVFGLATSVPLIIAGSALLMALLDRFPILVWAGAALLGWVAGDIMIKDTVLPDWVAAETIERVHHFGPLHLNLAAIAGATFVVGVGWLLRRAKHRQALEHPLIVDPPGPEEFPHPHGEHGVATSQKPPAKEPA
jgi:YjbE family integral membrane protein